MDAATFANASLKVGELLEELIFLLQQPDFPALLLKGAPGIGKTESVKWAARRCIHTDGAPYDLVILHPVGRDQSHAGGYPTIVNGEAVHVSYGDLRQLETASRPLVCLVDDFGQCAPSTQAAYQQLSEILADPEGCSIPDAPHEIYAECGSLAHAATPDNLPLLITYVGRFLFEYQEYFRQLIEVLRPDVCATTPFIGFVSALNEAR